MSVCGIHQLSERCGHGLQKHQSAHPVRTQKDCHGGHGGKAALRRSWTHGWIIIIVYCPLRDIRLHSLFNRKTHIVQINKAHNTKTVHEVPNIHKQANSNSKYLEVHKVVRILLTYICLYFRPPGKKIIDGLKQPFKQVFKPANIVGCS